MSDVTRILFQIDQGDSRAADQLLPLVYNELRKLAANRLAHEKPGQTLDATALVHEAYLRLVRSTTSVTIEGTKDSSPVSLSIPSDSFQSRGHFFAAAA